MTAATHTGSLVARRPLQELAAQAMADAEASTEQQRRRRASEEAERRHDAMVAAMRSTFGDRVAESALYTPESDGVSDGAQVDGLWFQLRRGHYNEVGLHVAAPCSDCDALVWYELEVRGGSALVDLALFLERKSYRHADVGIYCLQKYDEDGEPTTDRNGVPLASNAIRAVVAQPTPTPAERLTDALRQIIRDEIRAAEVAE